MISDDISLVQYPSKTFTCSPNGTLPNIGKALVKVNFLSHLQHLSGSLSVKFIEGLFSRSVEAWICENQFD